MMADDEHEEEEGEHVLDLDAQQLVLSVEAAKAQKALRRALRGKKASPIGTRLTMTSRSSFFADRVIPPSMVSSSRVLFSFHSSFQNSLPFPSDFLPSPADASDVHSLPRTQTEPRLLSRLLHLSHSRSHGSPRSLPSRPHDLRREGSLRRRHRHSRWTDSRGQEG